VIALAKGIKIHCKDILDSSLGQPVDLIYIDPPFFTQKSQVDYDDRWPTLDDYLRYMLLRFNRGWEMLRPGGVFVLHIDPRTSHYFKVKLDKVWGRTNFESEVIWSYNSGGASKKKLASKHDVLLVYRKPLGTRNTFNVLREPYASKNVLGRPGFHPEGRMLTDVWTMSFLSTTSFERTGYASQKPLELLERVIALWSNPGDLILDFFAGSGTTGAAAMRQGRRCVMYDINPSAVWVVQKRFSDSA
jgi:site-specific DNA-methyltransferase (adenine-specific)